MGDPRYTVKQTDSVTDMIPLPTTHTVTIRDNETGEEVKGHGTTVEKATENAWDKINE